MAFPRIAHLIASHHAPLQVRRLCSVIQKETPNAIIALHHDRFASPTPYAELADLSGIEIIEAVAPLRWGDYSMVRMVLDAIAELERRGVKYDWLNFLSGQDYPIRPLAEFEACLAASKHDAFLHAQRWDVAWPDENEERYFFHWYRLPDFPIAYRLRQWVKRNADFRLMYGRTGTLIGKRARRLPFPKEHCLRSSMWWTISRRAVERIMDWQINRPDFFRHYQRTLFPDESCLQTLMFIDESLRCSTESNLRCIFWPDTPDAASPLVLCMNDFKRLQDSGQYFARKFDFTFDPELGDALDRLRNY